MTKLIALTPALAGFAVLTFSLSTGAVPARAFEARTGQLHIVKDCGIPTNPANVCQIVSSNLDELPAGSLIFYDQNGPAPGTTTAIPESRGGVARGVMDSNIFIYVQSGDWAVGRCTLDLNTGLGVCTLSYGAGPLATISAKANVSYQPGGDGALFSLDGTYTFNPSGN
jgi:hypothetical protein